ncbi:unnamed protein product [Rotaria sp. Silwood2]|nr:unnamed protein product [Rotaria sp. Silwood2]CAF2855367.1 unnamed protein product [Rotaria sp. Silwood2]CAF4302367.1 unnamed protein product [Rotaria sp. Silwood2]CAF4311993.1 unnamed protein product [Rotaria sp. Silwood2]
MEKTDFEQLINSLSISPLPNDIFQQITYYLQQQTNDLLPSFVSQSFQSLINLEHWAWKLLSHDFHQWINQSNYLELFHSLGLFNFMLIFNKKQIETNTKSSLLIHDNIQWINQIFDQIEKIENHNDPFLVIVSCWFENLSYLIHEHTQFETAPIFIHICQRLGHDYLLTDQYKFYLTQLCQSTISQSIFTAKQLFYIKTCSFLFRMYICAKVDKSPFKGDELLNRFGKDYLQIIFIHSHTVDSWSRQLLTCITHLIDFMCACCWWGTEKALYIEILVPNEQIVYDHIQGLIRIVSCKSFHERITSQWNNDETILIDSIFIFFMGALLQIKNLNYFIRSETILSHVILAIAQKSCYDRISVGAYGILAEILSDKQLKELKITDNISELFFRILELALKHPTKRYKRFFTLSKNDAIQQTTADSNKISLLIEISDEYPKTLDILWSLSFNQDIQQQLCSNRSFMNKLTRLKEECNDEKMRRIIFGLLWNLESSHQDRIISEISDEKTFDIMISYSHKDEIICKKIYEELIKFGYRVWIDYDQIHGNVMDAMAQAIERSHTVIICMSEKYRKSNYCRAEAHYAFQRQVKIVPILLQEQYQPDGWLLFLIGQLLYVDFSKYDFPRAMELLIAELKAPSTQETQIVPVQSQQDNYFIHPLTSELLKLPENILNWTQIDVQNWLIESNLRQMARLLINFDGPSLNSLYELIIRSEPEQILKLFQDDCLRNINENISLLELARFRTLLNEQQRLITKSCNILNLVYCCRMM